MYHGMPPALAAAMDTFLEVVNTLSPMDDSPWIW